MVDCLNPSQEVPLIIFLEFSEEHRKDFHLFYPESILDEYEKEPVPNLYGKESCFTSCLTAKLRDFHGYVTEICH